MRPPSPRAACSSVRVDLNRVTEALAGYARVAVGDTGWMVEHQLPVNMIEKWLTPARRLQTRLDQPQLHELKNEDFQPWDLVPAPIVDRVQSYTPIGKGHRPIGNPVDDADQDRERWFYAGTTGSHSKKSLLQPVLQGIASGKGVSLLRLSRSAQHRELVAKYTPHELALAARGMSFQIGVQSSLERNQVQHLVQTSRHTREHGTLGGTPLAKSWLQDDSIEVTLVACLQDTSRDCAASFRLPEKSSREVLESDWTSGYRVWVLPATELLATMMDENHELASLLFEPRYCQADKPVQGPIDTHIVSPSTSDAGKSNVERGEFTAALWLTGHRGKPRAWDSRGQPRAFDSRDLHNQWRCRVAQDPFSLQVAPNGGSEHQAALQMLQRILLRAPEVKPDLNREVSQQQCHRRHQNTRSRWRLVELFAGDILLADSSVLLRHTPVASACASDMKRSAAAPIVHGFELQAVVFDEVEVLRSCAQSRAQYNIPKERDYSRSHALWMGLRRDRQPLKWWWW